jgi:hypothetical protein
VSAECQLDHGPLADLDEHPPSVLAPDARPVLGSHGVVDRDRRRAEEDLTGQVRNGHRLRAVGAPPGGRQAVTFLAPGVHEVGSHLVAVTAEDAQILGPIGTACGPGNYVVDLDIGVAAPCPAILAAGIVSPNYGQTNMLGKWLAFSMPLSRMPFRLGRGRLDRAGLGECPPRPSHGFPHIHRTTRPTALPGELWLGAHQDPCSLFPVPCSLPSSLFLSYSESSVSQR